MIKRFVKVSILLVAVIFVGAVGYLAFITRDQSLNPRNNPLNTPNTTVCGTLYNEIEDDLEKANYCNTDSDCEVLVLGGSYVAFGCYHFINKEVLKDTFYEKMKTYNQSCTRLINKCAASPQPSCITNKCVYVE